MKWQDIKSAPKDKPILLDMGFPWAVVGIWNEPNKKWAYAELQCDLYKGEWCDTYFHTEQQPENYKGNPVVIRWMVLPKTESTKKDK